jgi:hypothetical protein
MMNLMLIKSKVLICGFLEELQRTTHNALNMRNIS